MTSLYNPISKCFVVSKHGIFITYPTNYDVIILQRFIRRSRKPVLQIHLGIVYCRIVEVDRIRINQVAYPNKKLLASAFAPLRL